MQVTLKNKEGKEITITKITMKKFKKYSQKWQVEDCYFCECSNCNGDGFTSRDTLSFYRGHDTIDTECEVCLGCGEMEIDMDSCDACEGEGKVLSHFDSSGKIDNYMPCGVCDGSGLQLPRKL